MQYGSLVSPAGGVSGGNRENCRVGFIAMTSNAFDHQLGEVL
jgi:hypothetical protein